LELTGETVWGMTGTQPIVVQDRPEVRERAKGKPWPVRQVGARDVLVLEVAAAKTAAPASAATSAAASLKGTGTRVHEEGFAV
jgi:hypothetical protein